MCRSLEEIEEAAKTGGQLAKGGEAPLTVSQAFSLRHRGDLLEKCTREDVDEMRQVVLDTLTDIAGGFSDMCRIPASRMRKRLPETRNVYALQNGAAYTMNEGFCKGWVKLICRFAFVPACLWWILIRTLLYLSTWKQS